MTLRNEIPNTNQPCCQWPLLLRTNNSPLILGFPTIRSQFSQRCRQLPCLSTAGIACSTTGDDPPTSLSADLCLQIPSRFHLPSLRNSLLIPSPPSERLSHKTFTFGRRAFQSPGRHHNGLRRKLPLPPGHRHPSHDRPRRGPHGLPYFTGGQHAFTSEHAALARCRQRCRLDRDGRQAHQLRFSELGLAEEPGDRGGCAHGAIAEAVGRHGLGR